MMLVSLLLVTVAFAAAPAPQPHVKTAAELSWEAIPDTLPDAEQVTVARDYLDKYPTEIPLLRSVQNVLNRKSDLTLDFWLERMNANPSTANRYLYARKSGDIEIMKAQADMIIQNDSENFWGYYLAAVAEWSKDEPNMDVVIGYFEQAIPKDPSRPEGWGYAAQAYEEKEDWDNALRMYQAALVVSPEGKSTKMSILGIYAQKKDADAYFKLAGELLPMEPPLSIELGMHNSSHKVTASDFSGQYTVLELFTYW